jgi:hypothetical protein
VNVDLFKSMGMNVYPSRNGLAKQMTFTLGHVGLRPIINLQTAGYRVAQDLLKGTISNISQLIK